MYNKKEYSKISQLNLRSLVILSRTCQTVHQKEKKTIKESGLTVGQFGVLEALYHKGPMRISVVTEKILSTGGNMTVIINNLTKNGLIEKNKDIKDRRATIIQLTKNGEKLMKSRFPAHIKNIDTIFSPLTCEEKETLISLLKKLSCLR
jgi:DNA-binding MarR family transcriptional regulator